MDLRKLKKITSFSSGVANLFKAESFMATQVIQAATSSLHSLDTMFYLSLLCHVNIDYTHLNYTNHVHLLQ